MGNRQGARSHQSAGGTPRDRDALLRSAPQGEVIGAFIACCISSFHFESDSEETCAARRLEGWATGVVRVPTLRDALLRSAPQGEVIVENKKPATVFTGRAFGFQVTRLRRGRRSGRGSSPWSRRRRSPSRTSPSRRTGIDLGQRAQLRVRAEDQVDARAGPLDLAGLAVAALVDALASAAGFHSVPMSSRLTKKSLRQRARPFW